MGLSGKYGSCQQRQIGFDTNDNECNTPALKFQLKVLEFAVMGRWENTFSTAYIIGDVSKKYRGVIKSADFIWTSDTFSDLSQSKIPQDLTVTRKDRFYYTFISFQFNSILVI